MAPEVIYIQLECLPVHQQGNTNYEPRPAPAQDGETESNIEHTKMCFPPLDHTASE